MNTTLLTVSPSPHVHTALTVPEVMRGVIYAMLPALAFSVYNFGLGALLTTLAAVVSCVFFEYLANRFLLRLPVAELRQRGLLSDGSAIITGMLLAFNVPSNLPLPILLVGSAVAVGIGKMCFGGLGNNPFNPALVGRVFLLLSFPVQMTHWPTHGTTAVDGHSGATVLGLLKEGMRQGEGMAAVAEQMPSHWEMFVGLQRGSLGEISALAMVLGLAYLLYRRIVTWHIPVAMLTTIFIGTGLFWLFDPQTYADPIFHLLTGGVMIGAVFMATDYVTSPVTHRGMVVFGVGIGLITVAIRLFGSYPEGVSFAILIMNAFVPLINQYTQPRRYGAKTNQL